MVSLRGDTGVKDRERLRAIAEIFETERKNKGWTQDQLEKASYMMQASMPEGESVVLTQQTYQRYAAMAVRDFSINTIYNIARVLGLDFIELLKQAGYDDGKGTKSTVSETQVKLLSFLERHPEMLRALLALAEEESR
jgi:transcriptional regulator with XRE-family HTH domain